MPAHVGHGEQVTKCLRGTSDAITARQRVSQYRHTHRRYPFVVFVLRSGNVEFSGATGDAGFRGYFFFFFDQILG